MFDPHFLQWLHKPPVDDYVSPGHHLVHGWKMRKYQVRAAHKVFTGTLRLCRQTGKYVGPEVDGTNVHIDMGLGKTIIALTAVADWFKLGVLDRPVLVIAPIKVCESVWRQEARKWSHTQHLRFGDLLGDERSRAWTLARGFDPDTGKRGLDVILMNPEKIKWFVKYQREGWGYFDALIIDDVALKNHKSVQFRELTNYGKQTALKDNFGKALRDPHTGKTIKVPQHRFKRGAKMTGTPSTAGLHNIWAPNYLMDHGRRLMLDFPSFEARFFHKGQQVADHVHKLVLNKAEGESRPEYEAREGAPERIHELIADITIELNAEDYGVLPKVLGDASKHDLDKDFPGFIHRVDLPGEIRPKYDLLEKEAIIELMGNTTMAQNGGAKQMMCWQIANGAFYATDDYGAKYVQEVHDRKLDKLVELIDILNTNVVIPYYFQHDFDRITRRLKKEGMDYAVFKRGNTAKIVQDFAAGKISNLLLHPQSAGHGLDGLQEGGHTNIWFTLLWSLERYLQTLARLARSGQNEVVGNHHIVTSRTTDELMLINLRMNGNEQDRFRSAVLEYQKLRGIDYISQGGLVL